jgi:hypothetical protein
MTASTIKTVTLRNRGDYVEHHMLGVQHHSTSTSIGLLTVKLEPLRSCSMSVWLTYNNDRIIKVISTWLSHSFKRTAEKLSRHIVKIFFCLVNHAEVVTEALKPNVNVERPRSMYGNVGSILNLAGRRYRQGNSRVGNRNAAKAVRYI